MFNFTKPAIGYSVSHFIIIGMLGLAASNAKASSIAPVQMLEIRESGIGPLNGQTHFNQQEIQKLLPGFKVTAGVGAFEDLDVVSRGDQLGGRGEARGPRTDDGHA